MTVYRLRHLAEINPPTPAFDLLAPDDELTFLPMEAVWPGSRLDISHRRTKSAVITGYTRFQDGDVLVPKITPTFEAGRSVLIKGLHNCVGAGTTELHVLRAGPMIDPRFLLYLVNTHSFLKLGAAAMYGVAGQKRVPDSFLRDLHVVLPPIVEQRRIADFLDAETARIDQLSKLQRAVLGRIEERERALLDVHLEGLTTEVGTVPFRRYIVGVDQGSSPQCDSTPANPDQWGVLKVSCLRPGEFFPDENKRLPADLVPDKRHEVRAGDLLITRANTPQLVGSTAVVTSTREKLLLSDKIFRVKLSPSLDPHYAAVVAQGGRVRAACWAGSNGASQSMANIRFEEIKEWPIPAVDLYRQRQLADLVSKSRSVTHVLRKRIDHQLALLTERRQALITAAVTGQIDVSAASGRGIEEGLS